MTSFFVVWQRSDFVPAMGTSERSEVKSCLVAGTMNNCSEGCFFSLVFL